MRSTSTTIVRREHWRWQRCGVGRTELRHVRVRESRVTLSPSDTRQLDLLDRDAAKVSMRAGRRRPSGRSGTPSAPRTVLRSYWRNQPFGPQGSLRKVVLVDVTR